MVIASKKRGEEVVGFLGERGRGKTFVDRRPDFLLGIWRRRPGRRAHQGSWRCRHARRARRCLPTAISKRAQAPGPA